MHRPHRYSLHRFTTGFTDFSPGYKDIYSRRVLMIHSDYQTGEPLLGRWSAKVLHESIVSHPLLYLLVLMLSALRAPTLRDDNCGCEDGRPQERGSYAPLFVLRTLTATRGIPLSALVQENNDTISVDVVHCVAITK